jgi:hypothetical protein
MRKFDAAGLHKSPSGARAFVESAPLRGWRRRASLI